MKVYGLETELENSRSERDILQYGMADGKAQMAMQDSQIKVSPAETFLL